MKKDPLETISSILSGHGFEVSLHPGRENIDRPGYYLNCERGHIEHWSHECPYNQAMAFQEYMNSKGLIQDGFQSILPFSDVGELVESIQIWDKHLEKYGVK